MQKWKKIRLKIPDFLLLFAQAISYVYKGFISWLHYSYYDSSSWISGVARNCGGKVLRRPGIRSCVCLTSVFLLKMHIYFLHNISSFFSTFLLFQLLDSFQSTKIKFISLRLSSFIYITLKKSKDISELAIPSE